MEKTVGLLVAAGVLLLLAGAVGCLSAAANFKKGAGE